MSIQTNSSKRRTRAFTLIELLVIIAVLAVAIAVILPALAPPRNRKSTRIQCVNNLKNVGLAFRIFAADNQGRFPMQVSTNEGGTMELVNGGNPLPHFLALTNELSTPKILACPTDKKRTATTNFALTRRANVSYFVGLDSTELQPQTLLAGDRNVTTNARPMKPGLLALSTNAIVGWTAEIHNLQGNVAMGDGSVQQFSSARLDQALLGTGLATNRLAMP